MSVDPGASLQVRRPVIRTATPEDRSPGPVEGTTRSFCRVLRTRSVELRPHRAPQVGGAAGKRATTSMPASSDFVIVMVPRLARASWSATARPNPVLPFALPVGLCQKGRRRGSVLRRSSPCLRRSHESRCSSQMRSPVARRGRQACWREGVVDQWSSICSRWPGTSSAVRRIEVWSGMCSSIPCSAANGAQASRRSASTAETSTRRRSGRRPSARASDAGRRRSGSAARFLRGRRHA